MMKQLDLIPGYYHCHNCGQHVMRVRKASRFRLCDACYSAIVPDFPDGQAHTDAERQQVAAYWEWHHEIALRYPVPRHVGARRPRPSSIPVDADSHNPTCACGQPRRPFTHVRSAARDLFGGPFSALCPTCEARAAVEAVFRLANASGSKTGRDDEDWLDILARTHPEAFELGVLPGYWFECKLKLAILAPELQAHREAVRKASDSPLP